MDHRYMDTPEDIRVQERREGYNDDWNDAHDYQQMLMDEERDGDVRCELCGSNTPKVRYVVAYLGEEPHECRGPFHS